MSDDVGGQRDASGTDRTVGETVGAAEDETGGPASGPRLQIEAGGRGIFWQVAFPVLVVLLALCVPLAAWYGKESLLQSRGGQVEAPILDPAAPGYEAVVEPTPTMLVVQVADDDTLVGLTFLAQAGIDGGSVLFIPVNTSIEVDGLGLPDPSTVAAPAPGDTTPPGDSSPAATDTVATDTVVTDTVVTDTVAPTTTAIDDAPATTSPTVSATGALPLKDIYQLGGTPGVVDGVEKLLGIGVGERAIEIDGEEVDEGDSESVVEVTSARWQELVAPVAPLPVDNDNLVTVTDPATGEIVSQFPKGVVDLPAPGVGAFLEARNGDESELNRLARQQGFWLAWLEAVSQSDDPAVIPGEVDAGMGGFVRGLATSNVAFFNLPVDTVAIPGAGDDLFLADSEAVADLIVTLVPFPVGSDVSPRTRVRVLDGTGTEGIGPEAAHVLVRAGAEIELLGNAASFDHRGNDVIYYDDSMAETAQRYADALGGATIAKVDEPGEIVDLTVVVGADFDPDAIPDLTTTIAPTLPPSLPPDTTAGGD